MFASTLLCAIMSSALTPGNFLAISHKLSPDFTVYVLAVWTGESDGVAVFCAGGASAEGVEELPEVVEAGLGLGVVLPSG